MRNNPSSVAHSKSILTSYLSATNHKGARIKASVLDGARILKSITISYPHELNAEEAHIYAAEQMRDKMGWKGDLFGALYKHGYVFGFKHLARDIESVGPGPIRRNPRTSTSTRSEVRSPTSTRTSTRANTRGNVTITGGAGRGNTSVTLRRNPRKPQSQAQMMLAYPKTRLARSMLKTRRKVNGRQIRVEMKTKIGNHWRLVNSYSDTEANRKAAIKYSEMLVPMFAKTTKLRVTVK